MQPGFAKATWTVRTLTPAYLHPRPEYPQCPAPWKSCFRADHSPSCCQLQELNSSQKSSKEALNNSSDVAWEEGGCGASDPPFKIQAPRCHLHRGLSDSIFLCTFAFLFSPLSPSVPLASCLPSLYLSPSLRLPCPLLSPSLLLLSVSSPSARLPVPVSLSPPSPTPPHLFPSLGSLGWAQCWTRVR